MKINSWIYNDYSKFLQFCPPLKQKLYSIVANGTSDCSTILDYGCGEGNQIHFIDTKKEITLYDINPKYTTMAFNRFHKTHNLKSITQIAELPSKYFDSIILNMVWMCLQNEDEMNELLTTIFNAKKDTGIIYLSITNPYSRFLDYSYYSSDYSKCREFKYSKNGEKFKIYIKDEVNSEFEDFHWTMEFTIAKLKEFGLKIDSLIDIEDEQYNGYANTTMPPYQLLILK